jgi:hypothetical protein
MTPSKLYCSPNRKYTVKICLFVLNKKKTAATAEKTAAQNKEIMVKNSKIKRYEETVGTQRYDLIQEGKE